MRLPLTERIVHYTYDALAEAFGDIAGLLLLWILPAVLWAALLYQWLGIVYALVAGFIIALLWALILLVIASRT